MKPILAISLGDPAGIGPEIMAANIKTAALNASPILFGHWPTFEHALKKIHVDIPISVHEDPVVPQRNHITMVHCGPSGSPIDKPCRQSAEAQLAALERAVDAVQTDLCDGLVTAPVAKSHVAKVHPGFTGHTEYLASRSRMDHDAVTMIFASDTLAVGLVSTHLPLKRAAEAVTRPRLERTVSHLLDYLALKRPNGSFRIGVSAVNPHGGEQGLIGREEREIVEPFCQDQGRRPHMQIKGPIPADTLFREAFAGDYDGVVAAYHDQAMIPLKLLGPGRVVNVTWGLPFIRTSPDHGVAYDLAKKGRADPRGMKLAINLAIDLIAAKKTGAHFGSNMLPGKTS